MTVFGSYSRYYDLLYRDKDYAAEAEFVLSLVRKYCPSARTLLDLGCGTGRHASLFADAGYQVTGVDRSPEMLASAARYLEQRPGKLKFAQGDVRSVRLAETFDAVTSLFHVLSYQNSNADVEATLQALSQHTAPGGVFVFDFWYGPAVLTLKPSVRCLRLEDEATQVTRIAEPVLHPNQNVVDVNYQIFVTDKASAEVSELRETHSMRYFFLPELELLFEKHGLKLEQAIPFMQAGKLGTDTWTGVVIGRHADR